MCCGVQQQYIFLKEFQTSKDPATQQIIITETTKQSTKSNNLKQEQKLFLHMYTYHDNIICITRGYNLIPLVITLAALTLEKASLPLHWIPAIALT